MQSRAPIDQQFGNGARCIGGGLIRLATGVADANGTFVVGPGVIGLEPGAMPGQTRFYQAFYRDAGGPCGFSQNTTNALEITFEL